MWNDECIELLTMDDNHVITRIYLCPRNRLRCTHKNWPNNWSYVWIPKDTQCWVSCNRNSSDYYTFQLPRVSLTQFKLCQRFWLYECSRKSWQNKKCWEMSISAMYCIIVKGTVCIIGYGTVNGPDAQRGRERDFVLWFFWCEVDVEITLN